jgi:hypothetical protein
MSWLDTFTKKLGGDSSGGIADFDMFSGLSGFGSNDSNFGYDSSPSMADSAASFFETPLTYSSPSYNQFDPSIDPLSTISITDVTTRGLSPTGTTNYGDIQATGVGGPGTSLAYNANGDLVETQGTGGDTSGGITTTGGGGAGSAIADFIKKYGLPALLAGLAVKDRQKATGGGYGKAYQSPAPLTRTMSQGKYGPIAKYAADGGIIQGYKGGDSVRSSFGQLDQAPNPGALAREIAYDPVRNAKAVEAFARFINPLGMSINDVAQQIKAGNTEGIFKDIAKGMVPFYKTGEKLSEGDFQGAATSLVPGGIKALYNLITSPPSQSSQAAEYASAFGNPEGTTPSSQAVQAADYASAFGNPEGTTSATSFPTQNTDIGQFRDMVTIAPSDDLGGYQPPPGQQGPMRGLDQGNDLGAFNQGDSGAAPEPTGYTGPSYGNYDSGVGSNFNNPSGPGEGGFGAGSYDNSNLSESGFGYGSGASMYADYGSPKVGSNRDDSLASLMNYAQGGGIAAMAKGRFLRGPGDGVSDSIPATIDGNQPAALADGEFVIPARVVSELGNGSSEAGARKLHAMMVRIQKDRRGAKNIAANTKVDRHLPA